MKGGAALLLIFCIYVCNINSDGTLFFRKEWKLNNIKIRRHG